MRVTSEIIHLEERSLRHVNLLPGAIAMAGRAFSPALALLYSLLVLASVGEKTTPGRHPLRRVSRRSRSLRAEQSQDAECIERVFDVCSLVPRGPPKASLGKFEFCNEGRRPIEIEQVVEAEIL